MWKKWKLCHATDFQSLMYPCFIFCRMLGMFPYKINSSTFEASKLQYILSSIVICICCVYNGTFIHDLIFKINSGSMIKNLEAVCFFMLSGFIIIIMHFFSGSRLRVLQTILKVSSKLSPKSYQRLSRSIHLKDILGTIILPLQLILTLPKQEFFNNYNFLIHIFTLYCILLIFYMNMLYVNCIYVLNACLKNINDNLDNLQNLVINDTKPYVSTLIEYMERHQFSLTKLKTLKKWHLMISNAMQMLNRIFSLQIVATMIIAFSGITFELYFYAVRWQDGIRIIFNREFVEVVFIVLVEIYYVIIIMLPVWACETSKNQVQKIRTTIHDLHNGTRNEETKDELQLFSLQILHCENTFSVKGLTVDATLLAAMVGNITTYMLILMQFLITSHSCGEKSASDK